MSHQNLRNHYRYIPMWHFITSLAIIAVLIGSIVNLSNSTLENLYSASLIFVIALILSSFFWYARWFALRVQDRAIRAEETLRHFILTGKPLDSRLRMGQIIALRFAAVIMSAGASSSITAFFTWFASRECSNSNPSPASSFKIYFPFSGPANTIAGFVPKKPGVPETSELFSRRN